MPKLDDKLVDKLCEASRKKVVDPWNDIPWVEEVDWDAWYTAPQFISIHGTETYEALDEAQRKRLAFYEAVAFYSINIHGEKELMQGLAKRLYRLQHTDVTPYLHHFLDEENRHSMYFGRFCMDYAGKVYPNKKVSFPRELSMAEDDLLFFIKVMVFEEIVDVYNVTMGWDDSLHPVAKEINKLHHIDEARHLIFGREVVKILYDRCEAQWTDDRREAMRTYFEDYLHATWREYYNPQVYKDAGIPKPYDVAEEAYAAPACCEHRQRVSSGVVTFLLKHGMIAKEPAFDGVS